MRWLYQVHRMTAWVAGIVVVLWVLSGLLHPLMSFVGPRPASFAPPPGFGGTVAMPPTLRGVVARDVRWGDGWVRIAGAHGVAYVDQRDGHVLASAEIDHASMLARYYSGDGTSEIISIRRIESFSDDYPAVNRLLPVWEVVFDTPRHLTAYVDTSHDRLGLLTHDTRRVLSRVFTSVHTLSFLPGFASLGLIVVGMGCVMSMAAAGFLILIRVRTSWKPTSARQAHRLIAVAAVLPVMMFAATGLFHAVVARDYADGARLSADFTVPKRMPAGPAGSVVSLVSDGVGGAWWRFQTKESVIYRDEAGREFSEDVAMARLMKAENPTPVRGFSAEYGFVNKRLPVWRFQDGDAIRFIDPLDRVVTIVPRLGVIEQGAFTTLHKWQFLDPVIGRGPRDLVIVAFGLLILATALFGFRLMFRRRQD